jgi:hypothetical protein
MRLICGELDKWRQKLLRIGEELVDESGRDWKEPCIAPLSQPPLKGKTNLASLCPARQALSCLSYLKSPA